MRGSSHRRAYFAIVALIMSGVLLLGCGGKVKGRQGDALQLLKQGKYAEARAAAIVEGLDKEGNRAIVAISHILEAPSVDSAKQSVTVLSEENGPVRAAVHAVAMLDLLYEIPQPITTHVSMLFAEVALGATSYGPFALSTEPSIPVGAASRDLALAVLDRVAEGINSADHTVKSNRILAIWNGCFSLDGGTFTAPSDYQAWRLYKAISTIALFMKRTLPDSDLSKVLLGATIGVVENNPDICVAVRCDLSSPFDNLKAAMAQNLDALSRLEKAVVNATGCTRGTYAPTVP